MAAVPKLLVVDDDPTLVQLVGKMLAGLGEIRFATSGEAALKVADREAPDLILLDAQNGRHRRLRGLRTAQTAA